MKKTFKIFMMMIAILATSLSVAAKSESAKAVFTVEPKMVCSNCENKIQSNLRFEKGVSEVEASAEKQVVTITYNPEKTNVENLVKAFKKIGYTATQTTEKASCGKSEGGCCKAKSEGGCCKTKAANAQKTKSESGCCKAKADSTKSKTKKCH
jgi:copper chaperone CopZ